MKLGNLSGLIHRVRNCQLHRKSLIKFKLLFNVSGSLHLQVSFSLWLNCSEQAAGPYFQRHINLWSTFLKRKNCHTTKWEIIVAICKMLDWIYFINFRGNSLCHLATKAYSTFVWHELCYSWVNLVFLFQALMWWFMCHRC
jgi:hypothetical protein